MRDSVVHAFLVLVAMMAISTASSWGACAITSSRNAPAPMLSTAGYPAVKNFTVSSTPVLVDASDFDGNAIMSISCRNATENACYWGHADVDAGVGSSHCSSGCDTTAAMCADVKECYLECDASTTVKCHVILNRRLE